MKNRYGDEYHFEQVNDNTYTIVGNLQYWKYTGKPYQSEIDFSDLGAVDPSGGPYIELGMKLEGKKITRIYLDRDNIMFEVKL